MTKKSCMFIIVAIVAVGMVYLPVEVPAQGRGDGPVIYVTSQGLYYDSIVKTDLPPKGPFQLLEMGPNGLQTEFGPGDVGYIGGRWWKDNNGNGEIDEGETFMCPLLPPGRESP